MNINLTGITMGSTITTITCNDNNQDPLNDASDGTTRPLSPNVNLEMDEQQVPISDCSSAASGSSGGAGAQKRPSQKSSMKNTTQSSAITSNNAPCGPNGAHTKKYFLGTTGSDKGAVPSSSDSLSSAALSMAHLRAHSTNIITALILVLGMVTAAAFMGVGINGALQDQVDTFERSAVETVTKLESSFQEYVHASSMAHGWCHRRDFSRREFRELYEYLRASGLQFKAVQFDPNITHAERPDAEAEARAYYAENYPSVDYQGFRGFNYDNSTTLEPRTNQSFYFPIHYQEPVEGNEAALGLDYHSSESRKRALYAVFENKAPSMTDRLSLVKTVGQESRCGAHNGPSFGIVLMHPGVALLNPDRVWPRDIATIVLCIPDLLTRSTTSKGGRAHSVYVHDLSHISGDPVFMGAAMVDPNEAEESAEIIFLDEISLEVLEENPPGLYLQRDIRVANRIWTITVVDKEGRWDSNILFVALGGVFIIFASISLVVVVRSSERRNQSFNVMRAISEQEKANLILENARQATKTERELNDFIAHEVRNPVAAAMAACTFIRMAVQKENPLSDPESIELAREDLNIVDNALHFVNDLLRNMLDMHRAASKELQVTMAPVNLLHDVMEPVGGMLYQRGSKVKLIVECPDDLFIMADHLRLKQVLLNLGRNSTKFIDQGFIRLKAEQVDGVVKIYVDDSGSGIPPEKRQVLFAKFQKSLDVLSQGTGIGLYLCKSLVELMGGEIYLDSEYNSGIQGHPGTRFVVDLQAGSIDPPMSLDVAECLGGQGGGIEGVSGRTDTTQLLDSVAMELPEHQSLLFVDDDAVLRKLFSRAVHMIRPGWNIREAANGETALRLVETEKFDIIFIDMYMVSVEKQLLGTETVAELRSNGVTSRICGLSANDKEYEFYEAGADSFIFKPFECERVALTNTLCQVLHQDRSSIYNN